MKTKEKMSFFERLTGSYHDADESVSNIANKSPSFMEEVEEANEEKTIYLEE